MTGVSSPSERVYLYDSTLRDGSQSRNVDFTVSDKQAIAEQLDAIGIDFIEGGWPGANPTDDAFFANVPPLKQAQLTAFGMTRRVGRSAENDPGLNDLLQSGAKSLCIVGKSWAHQVEKTLGISRKENLRMIGESLTYLQKQGREVMFDAEHFFDGYKSDPQFALECIRTAYESGARWVVLCDTNGGSLPFEIGDIVSEVTKHIPGSHLGIHCHNDTETAVANSLAAVRAGVRQVQGTLNGLGERCGNANLISIIPNLMLKMGFETGVSREKLRHLTSLSRLLDERLNRPSNLHAPYVGEAAFAHKGGLHVSAMAKDSSSYEHIPPETVGNRRTILVSDKAGKSNILNRIQEMGLADAVDNARMNDLVREVKHRETQGYAYEGAEASFELLVRHMLGTVPDYFLLNSFRVLDERRWNARGKIITVSEATVKLEVGGERIMTVAEGNGPVNALDTAIRKALVHVYPVLKHIRLTDYKVRILTPGEGTKALTRVMIESRDEKGHSWTTLGVSHNVIDASYNALFDSITYKLFREGALPPAQLSTAVLEQP
jgi:2-isopropylmalate synthase